VKSINILRAIVFATAAAYLIFVQNHSVTTGMLVLQYVSVAIAFGSLVLFKIDSSEEKYRSIVAPGAIAAAVGFFAILSGSSTLATFTLLVAVFAAANAVAEFVLSTKSKSSDKLELRISAAIGILTSVVFAFGQLDDLNAVGFFSAYLSVLAVQRAIWLASPKQKD
jgi:uncharacterized membrane protein HdeD (DUF308 family)